MLSLTYILNICVFSIKLYLLMDLISVFNLRSCVKSHVICERHRLVYVLFFFIFVLYFFSQFRTSNVKRHPIQKHKTVTLMHFQLSLAHVKSTKKICVRGISPIDLWIRQFLMISHAVNSHWCCKFFLYFCSNLISNIFFYFFFSFKNSIQMSLSSLFMQNIEKKMTFVYYFNPRMVSVWYIKIFFSSILLRN